MSIFELSPKEFTALSVLIGFCLMNGLDADRQNSLGNFFMGIGQILETAAAQQAIGPQNGPENISAQQLKQLEERLAALEQRLGNS